MRVELSREVLEQPGAFRHLTAIAWMFTDARHDWVVIDFEAIRDSAWLAEEGARCRQRMTELAEKAARQIRRVDLRVRPIGSESRWIDPVWEVPADLAESVLRQPLVIVTENARCDGTFLQLLALRVGEAKLRRRLGDAAFMRMARSWRNPLGDNEWIAVRHGGGGTTGAQVELAVEAEPAVARRVLVLVDSDRTQATEVLGGTAGKVSKVCEQLRKQHGASLRLELCILRKREVENYLPREALRASRSAGLETWDTLGDEQKDYADLKEIFGAKLWRIMLEPAHRSHFHDRALRDRAGNGGRELDDIVSRLVALL